MPFLPHSAHPNQRQLPRPAKFASGNDDERRTEERKEGRWIGLIGVGRVASVGKGWVRGWAFVIGPLETGEVGEKNLSLIIFK